VDLRGESIRKELLASRKRTPTREGDRSAEPKKREYVKPVMKRNSSNYIKENAHRFPDKEGRPTSQQKFCNRPGGEEKLADSAE